MRYPNHFQFCENISILQKRNAAVLTRLKNKAQEMETRLEQRKQQSTG